VRLSTLLPAWATCHLDPASVPPRINQSFYEKTVCISSNVASSPGPAVVDPRARQQTPVVWWYYQYPRSVSRVEIGVDPQKRAVQPGQKGPLLPNVRDPPRLGAHLFFLNSTPFSSLLVPPSSSQFVLLCALTCRIDEPFESAHISSSSSRARLWLLTDLIVRLVAQPQ